MTDLSLSYREHKTGYYDSYLYRISKGRAILDHALAYLEREDCRAQLARRRAVNRDAAINRLPDEILEEILLLSMTPLDRRTWSRSELKTCHHWRKVAEKAPQIWSCLYLTERTPIKCIDLWIRRSAAAPLHVHLAPCCGPSFPLLWRRITQCSHRFQSLVLSLEESNWIDHIFPITFRVDNLRQLKIFWMDEIPFPSRTIDVFPSIATSQLRKLEIKTAEWQQDIVSMPTVAASSLVELVIEEQAPLDVVWSFLVECKQIQRLTWDLQHYRMDELWTPPSASFRTLERLWITGHFAAKFLLAADLPALRRLIVFNTSNQVNVCKAILGFTQITHLSMKFCQLSVQDVRSVYESLHHLEYFAYPWREETFGAILALTGWSEEPTGWNGNWHRPRMKQLHLAIGRAIARNDLSAGTVRSYIKDLMRVRARSEDAPLEVILDNSKETEQFVDLDVRRAPYASFPKVWS